MSMVNVSEPKIKPVNDNKPKMLQGLNQKVCGQDLECRTFPNEDAEPPGEIRHLTSSSAPTRNTVSPYLCPPRQADRKERRWRCG